MKLRHPTGEMSYLAQTRRVSSKTIRFADTNSVESGDADDNLVGRRQPQMAAVRAIGQLVDYTELSS